MVFTDLFSINELLKFLNSPIKEITVFEFFSIFILVFAIGYLAGIIKKRRY